MSSSAAGIGKPYRAAIIARLMPTYEYRCENGHTFEALQKFSDDPLTECEVCGAPVQRVLHSPAVHFKGSGFYTTDYGAKKKNKGGDSGDSKSASGSSDGDSSSNSSGESKSSDSGDSSSSSGSGDKAGASSSSSD